jgi:hypothetical protein
MRALNGLQRKSKEFAMPGKEWRDEERSQDLEREPLDVELRKQGNGGLSVALRDFVQALQASGVAEVVGPKKIDWAEALDDPRHPCSVRVCLRVCDESRWYAAVAAIATAVRLVPGVTMVVRLDRLSELDLDVPPWVPDAQRYRLLSAALRAATSALHGCTIHPD